MTDKELWQASWTELTLTTDSYPTWVKKGKPGSSHWAKAKALGDQIGTAAPPPPTAILWGALLDGNDTYSFYYGDPASNGQSWQDAPWGNTGNTWDRFEQNAGKRMSVCHYGQPPPWRQTAFFTGTADLVTARGAVVLMSMRTESVPLRDIAAGMYDAQIATWAANVKTWGKRLILRLDCEMNGTWEPYGPGVNGNTAQDFVNMWRHFHDVAVGAGATNVEWFWCPNIAAATDSGSVHAFGPFYPGDAYVDWTGLDGYNQGSSSQTFTQIFKGSYDLLLTLAPSKQIGLGEFSSAEYGGQKAAWIKDALAQLPVAFPRIKMIIWFNWRILEGGVWKEWPIETSPSAQAAFKAAIANPYFQPGA